MKKYLIVLLICLTFCKEDNSFETIDIIGEYKLTSYLHSGLPWTSSYWSTEIGVTGGYLIMSDSAEFEYRIYSYCKTPGHTDNTSRTRRGIWSIHTQDSILMEENDGTIRYLRRISMTDWEYGDYEFRKQ